MNTSVDAIEDTIRSLLRRQLSAGLAVVDSQAVELGSATNLVAELALDSFAVMELLMEVEDHYDIVIDISSLSNARTLRDLASVVHSRVAG